ncbi:hypothetical protein TNCV_3045551 [Trichonephila clavipes]|nr:hypothetical protein TNCV_3045551 [Trichonephila clavipes]
MSEGPNLAPLQVWKKNRTCIQTPVKQGYGAILLQEAEDGKLHPVLLHVEKDKYSRRKNISEDYAKKGSNYSHSQMGASIEEFDYEINTELEVNSLIG